MERGRASRARGVCLEECAREGGALADELARADSDRLRETGEHVRRAADCARQACEAIRFGDRALLGGE